MKRLMAGSPGGELLLFLWVDAVVLREIAIQFQAQAIEFVAQFALVVRRDLAAMSAVLALISAR